MSSGSRVESRQLEVSEISRGIKAMARELDVPVLCLSQLNRAAEQREGHRPRMSDLRESGSIEQDADVVMMLHREDYYHRGDPNWADENPDKVGTAELILAKQRNGPTGTVDLVWDGATTSFKSRAYSAMPDDMGRGHQPRNLAAPTRMRVAEEPSDDLPV
jgi:replicative DNA helicase